MTEPTYPRPQLTPLQTPPTGGGWRTWGLVALALVAAAVVLWLLFGR